MITKNGEWWNYDWVVAPGCTKVSPECDNCWALAMAKRLQGMHKPGYTDLVDPRGLWTGKVSLMDGRLEDPLRLKKPRVIAVNLMGDLFHPNIPFGWQLATFKTMQKADWHTYMVLTKRAETAAMFLKNIDPMKMRHVFIGTTAGTQWSANTRWSSMMLINQLGWNTWVSSEPRLEAIDWHGWSFLKRMVTGGESGPYARPMYRPGRERNRDWCQAHEVAFWFKQWGEWAPAKALPEYNAKSAAQLLDKYPTTTMAGEFVFRLGRRKTGRVLDGRTWEEERNGRID